MLPFLEKDDFREAYPFGLFSAPLTEIVEIHASSGTTGKPTVVGYTRGDIEIWGEVMGRTFAAGGVGTNDILQNAYGYGLFTGGLGGHYGASKVGASVIPMSTGNTRRQLQILQDFGTTAICCTPSYAILLGEAGREIGMNFEELPLRVGFFGAEPWSESMRAEIERLLVLEALDIYGLSEVIGPGVAYECLAQQGLHIAEDHFFPEIINPQTLEYVPDGTHGELVFTTLTKTGLPLIRYRSGDLASLDTSPCPCGRSTARMSRVFRRTDDMVIIHGMNLFPADVARVLTDFPEVSPHFQLVVEHPGALDELNVRLELAGLPSDISERVFRVRDSIAQRLRQELGVDLRVTLLEPRSLSGQSGKYPRVVDQRNV